jgi:hypothetical protein
MEAKGCAAVIEDCLWFAVSRGAAGIHEASAGRLGEREEVGDA